MREHPIPQDVTGYRFHIVGSMTLKQFAEVFLGVLVAVVIYGTNLISPVKWILIFFSVGLGGAAAFLPIEERPLDHWIYTFFKVMYRPTQFFWRKTTEIPDPFLYKPTTSNQKIEPEVDLSPARRERIKEYITSVNTPSEYISDFSEEETQRMRGVLDIFESQPVLAAASPQTTPIVQPQKPQLEVRVRSMRAGKTSGEVVVFQQPVLTGAGEGDDRAVDNPDIQPPPPQPTETTYIPTVIYEDISPELSIEPTVRAVGQVIDVGIPQNKPTAVKPTRPATKNQDGTQNQQLPTLNYYGEQAGAVEDQSLQLPILDKKIEPKEIIVADVSFNADLPFPDPPTEPNKIVGMVLTPGNELITDAIVEIQTLGGQIIRAVKTNALGQFFVSTPLKSGDYVLSVEKSDFQFTPQQINLTGGLVAPLEIRSL